MTDKVTENNKKVINNANQDDEEYLEFYDPESEQNKIKLNLKREKEIDNPVKMVMMNGKLVPMTSASGFLGSVSTNAGAGR